MPLYFTRAGRTDSCEAGLIPDPDERLSIGGIGDAHAAARSLRAQTGSRHLARVLTSYTHYGRITGVIAAADLSSIPSVRSDERLDPRHVPDDYIEEPYDSLPWGDEAALVAL